MPRPVRPRKDIIERVHDVAGKLIAFVVLAAAVLLIAVHAFGLAEKIHLPEEYLAPAGVALLSFFYLAVVYGQQNLERQLEELKAASSPREPGWAEQIRRDVPEDINEIFGPELDRSCQTLRRAVVDREFVIRNVRLTDRFSSAYGRILRRFPNSTFYATAPANRQYWSVFLSNAEGSPNVIDEFRRFLDGGHGAAMKRIFFVEDPQHLTREECEIIRPQVPLLTATHIASVHTARKMDCLRYFAVEATGRTAPRLSWEVRTDGFEITEVVTSLDRDKAQEFLSDWERIKDLFPTPITVEQIDGRLAELRGSGAQSFT